MPARVAITPWSNCICACANESRRSRQPRPCVQTWTRQQRDKLNVAIHSSCPKVVHLRKALSAAEFTGAELSFSYLTSSNASRFDVSFASQLAGTCMRRLPERLRYSLLVMNNSFGGHPGYRFRIHTNRPLDCEGVMMALSVMVPSHNYTTTTRKPVCKNSWSQERCRIPIG